MYSFMGFILGLLTPFQISMNTRLNKAINNVLVSTFYIFGIGSVFTFILTLLLGQSPFIPVTFWLDYPFWLVSGALLGVYFIFGNIIALSKIGITQTALLPLIGQFSASLLIDTFGLFYIPKQDITIQKLIGISLLIIGIVCVTLSSNAATPLPKGVLKYQLLAISLGANSTIQSSINGHLGTLLHSPIKAGLYNFIIPTILMAIVLMIKKIPLKLSKDIIVQSPKWMWIGTIIGALFVSGASLITTQIGANLFVMTMLLGVTIGSLIISHFGLLENMKRPVTFKQLAYLIVAIIGVFLQLFSI